MARTTKLTQAKLNQIGSMLAEGKTAQQIADLFGCTLGTLRVRCSNFKISLRPPGARKFKTNPDVHPIKVTMTRDCLAALSLEAQRGGLTGPDLASRLLHQVVADNLYKAVLDE